MQRSLLACLSSCPMKPLRVPLLNVAVLALLFFYSVHSVDIPFVSLTMCHVCLMYLHFLLFSVGGAVQVFLCCVPSRCITRV